MAETFDRFQRDPVERNQDWGRETRTWTHDHSICYPFDFLLPTRPVSPSRKGRDEISDAQAELEAFNVCELNKKDYSHFPTCVKIPRKSGIEYFQELFTGFKPNSTSERMAINPSPTCSLSFTSSPVSTIRSSPVSKNTISNRHKDKDSYLPSRSFIKPRLFAQAYVNCCNIVTLQSLHTCHGPQSAPLSTICPLLTTFTRGSLALPVTDLQPVHSVKAWNPPIDASKRHLEAVLKSFDISVVATSPRLTLDRHNASFSTVSKQAECSGSQISQNFASNALGVTKPALKSQLFESFGELDHVKLAPAQELEQPVAQLEYACNPNILAHPKLLHPSLSAFGPVPLTSSLAGDGYSPSSLHSLPSFMLPSSVNHSCKTLASSATVHSQYPQPTVSPPSAVHPVLLPPSSASSYSQINSKDNCHHPTTKPTSLEAGKKLGKIALKLASGMLVATATATPVGGAALVGGAVTQHLVRSLGNSLAESHSGPAPERGIIGSLIGGGGGNEQHGGGAAVDRQLHGISEADSYAYMQPALSDMFKFQQQMMFYQTQMQMQQLQMQQLQMQQLQIQQLQMQLQMMHHVNNHVVAETTSN